LREQSSYFNITDFDAHLVSESDDEDDEDSIVRDKKINVNDAYRLQSIPSWTTIRLQ